MNSVLRTLIVLSAFTAAAYGLQCRHCFIGVFDSCFFGKDVTCNNSTESCYRGEAKFNATSSVSLHTRGCLDSDLCGVTLTGDILGAAYTSSFSCCTSDLCNAASSVSLSLSAVLCVAVTSTIRALL